MWNPAKAPSQCSGVEEYECDIKDAGNCQDVGTSRKQGIIFCRSGHFRLSKNFNYTCLRCCYVCPCQKMPILDCDKNLGNFEDSVCYGTDSDDVCGCTKETDKNIEQKQTFDDSLYMDDERAYCELKDGIASESFVLNQVMDANECANDVK